MSDNIFATEAIYRMIEIMKKSSILQEDFTLPDKGVDHLERHMSSLTDAAIESNKLHRTREDLEMLVVGFILGYGSANDKLKSV